MNTTEEQHRQAFIEKNDAIAKLINAIPECNSGFDVDWTDLNWTIERFRNNYNGFDFNPDFQRGHVWTLEQQIKYVEACFRHTVGDTARTITLNCPEYKRDYKAKDSDLDGFVVVDGLQRLTAVINFLDDEFTIFNDKVEGGMDKNSFDGTLFSIKSGMSFKFNILNMQYKKELINYYLAFNAGGTVHSADEIERVKQMLVELEKK